MAPFRILTVCTANICRSASAAALLSIELSDALSAGLIQIESSGTHALESAAACGLMNQQLSAKLSLAQQQLPDSYREHAARQLTREQLAAADLVLALDRGHSGAIAQLLPTARPRTFTLRQAAALMSPITASLATGDLPTGAPALPPDISGRLEWIVTELDAGRGLSVIPADPDDPTDPDQPEPQSSPYDVLDPHVVGASYHATAANRVISATNRIAEGLKAAMRA